MQCPEASFTAFSLLCSLLALMVISVAWGSNPGRSGLFESWRDVWAAYFASRNRDWRVLIFCAALFQVLRTTGWGMIAVTAGAGFPIVAAICLDVPAIINAFGNILDKIDSLLHKYFYSKPLT